MHMLCQVHGFKATEQRAVGGQAKGGQHNMRVLGGSSSHAPRGSAATIADGAADAGTACARVRGRRRPR